MTTRITLLIMTVLLLMPAAVHADDSAQITALFAAVTEDGGIVTIPPGDYLLDGAQPIPLTSGTTVMAYGARFHLPEKLGDKARVVLFAGENVTDFRGLAGILRACF